MIFVPPQRFYHEGRSSEFLPRGALEDVEGTNLQDLDLTFDLFLFDLAWPGKQRGAKGEGAPPEMNAGRESTGFKILITQRVLFTTFIPSNT